MASIQNDACYRHARQAPSDLQPDHERTRYPGFYSADVRGDRSLTFRNLPCNRAPLTGTSEELLKHLSSVGFRVRLKIVDADGEVILLGDNAA